MTTSKQPPFALLLTFLLLLGVAYLAIRRPTSAVNGGSEDPAIRDVEAIGGVCNRLSYWREYYDYDDLEGNPVVEVELGGSSVTYRSDPEVGRSPQGARVTDAVLAKFHLLPELRILSLRDTVVTDDGLKALVTLRHLRNLDLVQSRVTDDGLKHLVNFEELFRLGLASTAVTDEGMKYVVKLRSLTQLDLSFTKVGDAGLAELTAVTELYSLELRGTRVTDAGLIHLTKLRHLKFLDLPEETVTPQAAKNLKKALPECRVTLAWTEIR